MSVPLYRTSKAVKAVLESLVRGAMPRQMDVEGHMVPVETMPSVEKGHVTVSMKIPGFSGPRFFEIIVKETF